MARGEDWCGIHPADYDDFLEIIRAWRGGLIPRAASAARRSPPGSRPLIRAILLEDLESGGDVPAAVTRRQRVDEIQRIDIEGTVSGGHFKLKFGGETTGEIPYNATAIEMRAALEALSQFSRGDLIISAYSGRWLVQFTGQYSGVDVDLITVAENALDGAYNRVRVSAAFDWVDAARTESIHGQIPVGIPTPLRAGVIITAGWIPEAASYCIINVECRDLEYDVYGYGS